MQAMDSLLPAILSSIKSREQPLLATWHGSEAMAPPRGGGHVSAQLAAGARLMATVDMPQDIYLACGFWYDWLNDLSAIDLSGFFTLHRTEVLRKTFFNSR